jgi:hypothetical protein
MSHSPETIMQKLIDQYRANPTETNAIKLLAYDRKHPFASMLLTKEDTLLLARLMVVETLGA